MDKINNNSFLNINKTNSILLLIIIFSFFIDKIYLLNISYLPAWDQGYHLTNLFKTYNLLESLNLNSQEWWDNFWGISETYRGPITYIFSSFFLKFFGKSYENSLLSNNIFSIITILCIYNICREFGNKKAGLWAAFIFAFNPYIFEQRVDYLIDISQICFLNLNFYVLYKYFKSNGSFLLSIILGLTLGFLFLTKPTGILLLAFPYIYTFYLLIISSNLRIKKILNLIFFFATFITTIWPWFSINWLTIITSIINSWQWGIKYQDGLEANTLQGIIFYPKTIIKLTGPFILGSILIIYSLKIFNKFKKSKYKINYANWLDKTNLFLFSLPINILIVCTLMSTKDLRFILPIFPFLCVCLGLLITSFKNYNWVKFYKINIFALILIKFILHLSFQKNIILQSVNSKNPDWPHKEIIEKVSKFSPYSESVIAILPDTKELNTFNLASEAELQNTNVSVRQIISNEKSFKDDLNRFNWFVLKSGDQGIMSNNAKIQLSKLIEKSNLFEIFNLWNLPDGSTAKLYKRKITNESISKINENFVPLKLDLIFNAKGISVNLKGNNKILSNSNLLVDAIINEKNYEINIALPKIINIKNNNVSIIKNLNFEQKLNYGEFSKIEPILITEKNKTLPVNVDNIFFDAKINNFENDQFEINKINEVEKMGRYLKIGEFDKLFNLVSLVNQSDPNQKYLKDAEKIFEYRYQINKKNYDYLYNIAISQILQRKSIAAANTLKKIIKFDNNNANLYLAKSVVDIYNFNPKQAEKNILIAKKLNNEESLYSTINTIQKISDILNLKIRNLI